MYTTAWSAYLILAQNDRPAPLKIFGSGSSARLIPYVPLAPFRCFKVLVAVCRYIRAALQHAPLIFDWLVQYRLLSNMPDVSDIV